MTRWVDLYGVHAEFESDVINLTSDFTYFLINISHKYENNDGVIALDIRVSEDSGETWTEWMSVNNNPYHTFIDGKEFAVRELSIQYRVIMDLGKNLGGNSPVFDFIDIGITGSYKIINEGDVVCKPEIWIKKINGSGDIKLRNETNNETLEFKNLNNGETVYVDCDNEVIMTDLPMKYRYNDHNNVFIEFDVGENILSGEGDFELDLRYSFKTLQG